MAGTTSSLGAGQSDFYLLKTRSEFSSSEEPRAAQPESFVLSAFPNPFNSSTQIAFTLPRARRVELAVYDIAGRGVRTLTVGGLAAGEHRVEFDGSELPSGVYFARLSTGNTIRTTKLLLLK